MALLIISWLLISQSFVQNWLANKATAYLSRELGTAVHVEKVSLRLPLAIDLQGITIDDRQGNPFFRADRVQTNIPKYSLRKKYFHLGRINIENLFLALTRNRGEADFNYQFIADYFAVADTGTSFAKPLKLELDELTLVNATFAYRDYSLDSAAYGIDFNHLQLKSIHFMANNLSFINDTLKGRIEHLEAADRSGFNLRRLSGSLFVCPTSIELNSCILQAMQSDLLFDFAMHFNSFGTFSSFTDSVYLQADILPSSLNLNDLSWFAPAMKGMDNPVEIEGKLGGEIANLGIKDLRFTLGSSTRFVGNLSLNGLPNIDETFIHLDIKELITRSQDIAGFRLPSDNGPKYLTLSDEFKTLGLLRVKARFTGFYNDFVSYGTFNSNLGQVKTDIALRYDFESRRLEYNGSLAARNFSLAQLMKDHENFGVINLATNVSGTGRLPSTFDLVFNAVVDSFDFRGNSYNRMHIKGELKDKKFDGHLSLSDELIQFGFQGLVDMNDDPPVFDFSALLVDAQLGRMNLVDRDASSKISSRFTFNFSGASLNDLRGSIRTDSTHYTESGKHYFMNRFVLEAYPDIAKGKTLTLRSDFADADIQGVFEYDKLWPALRQMLSHYLPSLKLGSSQEQANLQEQFFNTVIRLKNTNIISELFLPGMYADSGSRVEVRFDSRRQNMMLKANSKLLTIKGIKLNDLALNILAQDKNLEMVTSLSHLYIKEPSETDSLQIGFENMLLASVLSNDTIHYHLGWADQQDAARNQGNVGGFLSVAKAPDLELKITRSQISIDGAPWVFNRDNHVSIESGIFTISNLVFESADQKIMADGRISSNPADSLQLHFNDFNISNLNPVLQFYGIDARGILSGNVVASTLMEKPNFLANLVLKEFTFNEEKLGDLFINATWGPDTESVWFDTYISQKGNIGTVIPLSLTGNYYAGRHDNELDFRLKLNNFKLQTLNPYTEGLMSNIHGLGTGELSVKGAVSEPAFEGTLQLMRAGFRLDYTNITYSLADMVHFDKNRIYGDNIHVFDNYGNSGICDIVVHHKNFRDLRLDARLKATKLAGLDTDASQNSLFFGKAYASGTAAIYGPFDDIALDLKLRTDPGTNITIPINFAVDVADNSFIVFKNPTDTVYKPTSEAASPSSFRMNMDMDVTRDAAVQIFLPYQMGNIRSTGNGQMKLHYNTSGDFTMYGNYYMHQGTFLFTVQNLINRPFVLESGGVIRWSGSPYDAEIELSAIYKVKVNFNSLPNISEEYRNRRFPVDCVLKLRNNLLNPDITFTLRMPNVDQNIQREVFSALDTTNQAMMSRQTISLLLLGNFNFSMEQGNFASTLGTSSFDLISSQLSNWLSQISKDFDIGVNYRPGDALTPEELELALSTQLFDDRVLIDGNFLRGNRNTQKTGNWVGEGNAELLLTRDGRLRIRAFNKYNDLEISRREAMYTQGVGLFYRREFNNLNDLLRQRPKTPLKGEVVDDNQTPVIIQKPAPLDDMW